MFGDQPSVIPIWPEHTLEPGASNLAEQLWSDPASGQRYARNVTQPTLAVFLPDPTIATGTAVLVCPGGGHNWLAIDKEGMDVARWLMARGVAAFMLKYRLIETPKNDADFAALRQSVITGRVSVHERMRDHAPLVIADGQQAIRLIRQRAAAWNIAPDRIGILGFSAGGQIAAGVALQHDGATRPDFAAVIYGAGWDELDVPADAPPLFIALAQDDPLAVESCERLYTAWRGANQSVEMHIYSKGGHGFGIVKQGLPCDHWIELLEDWIRIQGANCGLSVTTPARAPIARRA